MRKRLVFLPIKCSMHGTDADVLDPMDVGWAAFTLTTRPKLDVEIHTRRFLEHSSSMRSKISQCRKLSASIVWQVQYFSLGCPAPARQSTAVLSDGRAKFGDWAVGR